MGHQWFVGLSQVVWGIKHFGSYSIFGRSWWKDLSTSEGDFFFVLFMWMVSRAKQLVNLSWGVILLVWGKVDFWILVYILSVNRSQSFKPLQHRAEQNHRWCRTAQKNVSEEAWSPKFCTLGEIVCSWIPLSKENLRLILHISIPFKSQYPSGLTSLDCGQASFPLRCSSRYVIWLLGGGEGEHQHPAMLDNNDTVSGRGCLPLSSWPSWTSSTE